MILVLQLLLGAAAAAGVIHFAREGGRERERRWYAVGLAIAAGIYAAFNFVIGGIPLGIELLGLVGFGALGYFGFRREAAILAVGWLLHAGWDVWHLVGSFSSPDWYAAACIGFDGLLAGYILTKFNSTTEPSVE